MKVQETKLNGCFVIEPTIFKDGRGYFFESYNKEKFNQLTGLDVNFIQDNQSFSKKGVIRAIHYQVGEFAQAKLVRVLDGVVLDVAVDLRKHSPTFGEHIAIELSSDNKKQLFIPRGFGHGFIVLSETAKFFYKCDNFYNKEAEGGIIYNDDEINIDWTLDTKDILVSPKDILLPKFKDARL